MNHTVPKIPRRVVTGHKNGVATILEDKPVEGVMSNDEGFVISDPWATDSMPAKQNKSADIFGEFFPKLHKNGTLFRYVHIPPDHEAGVKHAAGQPHPFMHKTATLDYIIILSGEIYLIMEDCETLLKPGDIVIQCGTNHAWSNRSNEPCTQVAILLDAS